MKKLSCILILKNKFSCPYYWYIKFSNKYYYKDMEPLCNQVLHNQFETFHRCYKHIEGVRVIFSRQENLFWQNYCILDLDNFHIWLQYWVASFCNQFLPEYSSNQFETLHRCYKHIEDVHVTFSGQENHFWQNFCIFDLDDFQVRFQ